MLVEGRPRLRLVAVVNELYVWNTDYDRLYPGHICDITTRGGWRRDYDNARRCFKFRYYWRRLRVPELAWMMFS